MRAPPLLPALVLFSPIPTVVGQQFYWSYQAKNTTQSYDPVFEACGTKSCGDCSKDARACYADTFANICYEPANGETCCRDKYGTSCYEGYYCGYDAKDVAFCCRNGDDVNKCGALFKETLTRSTTRSSTAVTVDGTRISAISTSRTVTAVFSASINTSNGQSFVARPERTAPPDVPGGTKGVVSEKQQNSKKKDISVAVKVGIAIASVVGAAILITLVIMLMLHRTTLSRYNRLGEMEGKGTKGVSANTVPITSGVGALEPMRGEAQLPLYTRVGGEDDVYMGGAAYKDQTVVTLSTLPAEHQSGIAHLPPPPRTPGLPMPPPGGH